MQRTLTLLVGAAAASLSFGAAAQPATQAQGATQQQSASDTAAQQTSQDSTATQGSDVKPVTAADVKAGTAVNNTKGDPVGKVESVSGKSAVISTGSARAQIPLASLGRNDKGLVIAMTKAEFDAAAKPKTRKQ